MTRPLRVHLSALFLTIGAASPAFAQSNDASVATELFNTGRDLMKQGNFTAACPKLAESARLDTKVGTLARLAECDEKLGHMVSARAHWEQAVNLAHVAHDDRLAHCQSELARIDAVVPKLRVSVRGTPPDGLALRVDDLSVGAGSLGVALPIEAGKHFLTASAPGRKPWSTTVEAKGDGAVNAVEVPELVVDATPQPQPTPPPREQPAAPPSSGASSGSPLRTVGLITAGVGALGLAAGTVFAVLAKQKLDDSNAQGCDATSNCPGGSFDTRNQARSDGDLSTVFFVGGGVLLAGGLTMWLVAPKPASTRSASFELAPSLGLHAAGASMRGSF
jgi:hypothetical protein